MIINVNVTDKIARAEKHDPLVCGNSDYIIDFTFDEEWDGYQAKTARFIFDDRSYIDVVFDGDQCPVPVLKNTHDVIVGVYAGNLRTTTPAYLHAQRSILCGSGVPADPDPDVYTQLMAMLNELIASGGATPEQIAKAVEKYLAEHPVEGVTAEEVQEAVNTALKTAKDSGEFDGPPGEPGPPGDPGLPGDPGRDGVSVTHSWSGTTLTVSSASGTSSADLKGDPGYTPQKGIDYFDGAPGAPGKDGYTPVKGKDYFDGQDGYTPQKGVDYFDGAPGAKGDPGDNYVLTEADKEEIAEMAAGLVEVPEGGTGGGSATVVHTSGDGYKYSYIGCPFPAQNVYQSWPIAGVQYDTKRNRVMCLVTDADKHVDATQFKLTLYALDPETSAIEVVAVLKDNTVNPVISVSDAFSSQRGFLIDKDTGIYYKYHFGDDRVSCAAKSSDGGVTWEDITITETNSASILYAGGNGQIIKTSTGRIICGLFANGFAYTDDYFQTLTYYTAGRYGVDGAASGHEYEIIEYEPRKLIAIMRKTWQSRVGETWSGAQRVEPAAIAYSNDNGTTWTMPVESKTITNMSGTNCCSFLKHGGMYELFVGTRYAAVEGELTAMYRYTASANNIANDAFKLESRTFYGVGDAALDGIANLAGCTDDRGAYHLFWNDQQAYGDICRWHYMKIDPVGDNSSPAMAIPDNKEVQAYTAAVVDKKLEETKHTVQDLVNAGAQWTTVFETTTTEVLTSFRGEKLTIEEYEKIRNASEIALSCTFPLSETQTTFGSMTAEIQHSGGYTFWYIITKYNGSDKCLPTTDKTGKCYVLVKDHGTSGYAFMFSKQTNNGTDKYSWRMQDAPPEWPAAGHIFWHFEATTEFPAGSTFKVEIR